MSDCRGHKNTTELKIFAGENFAKPSYLRIAETFFCVKFICQCGKDRHIVYVISNAGEKICRYKLSPRAGGKVCHLDKLCIDWQCTYVDKLHECGLSIVAFLPEIQIVPMKTFLYTVLYLF